ncbi:hypothetical protein [Calothrix sp. NIES-3974]|nr:hypothetical protein [Calothrix sp. NIES-3974]
MTKLLEQAIARFNNLLIDKQLGELSDLIMAAKESTNARWTRY